jgi:hypothetical protein
MTSQLSTWLRQTTMGPLGGDLGAAGDVPPVPVEPAPPKPPKQGWGDWLKAQLPTWLSTQTPTAPGGADMSPQLMAQIAELRALTAPIGADVSALQAAGVPAAPVQNNNVAPVLNQTNNINVTTSPDEAAIAALVAQGVQTQAPGLLDQVTRQVQDAIPRMERATQ